jgi:hypothetical protein
VKTLAICRVKEGVDPGTAIRPHAAEEIRALQALKKDGVLHEAYSPGGPGAILIFVGDKQAVAKTLGSLPLYRADLLDVELVELKPFPGFE